jgi:hypothetical protein
MLYFKYLPEAVHLYDTRHTYSAISELAESGKKVLFQFLELVDLVFGPESPALAGFKWLIEKLRNFGQMITSKVRMLFDQIKKAVVIAEETVNTAVVQPVIRAAQDVGTTAKSAALAAAKAVASALDGASAAIKLEASNLQRYLMERTVAFGTQIKDFQEQFLAELMGKIREVGADGAVRAVAEWVDNTKTVVKTWCNQQFEAAVVVIRRQEAEAKAALELAITEGGFYVDAAVSVAQDIAQGVATAAVRFEKNTVTTVVNGIHIVVGEFLVD